MPKFVILGFSRNPCPVTENYCSYVIGVLQSGHIVDETVKTILRVVAVLGQLVVVTAVSIRTPAIVAFQFGDSAFKTSRKQL